jgi:predicted AlkP superfamily phosphohydrolase/phosphomutase
VKKSIAVALVLIFAVILGVGLFFFVFHKKASPLSPRIVILGLDGASWNFIRPLLKEGKLPHFQSLMDEGSSGLLQTIAPTKSSIIWTSIATGNSMAKHGIVDWTYVQKNNVVVPYRQSERRAKAFWNILSDRGKTVGVINWFITFPPEEVKGFMVSEEFRNFHHKDFTNVKLTYPELLLKTLEFARPKNFQKIIGEENIPDYKKANPTGQLTFHFPNYIFQNKMIEEASFYLFKSFPVEVFATYFQLIDVVSHFASSYLDPELLAKGKEEEKMYGKPTPETLELIETAYSKVLEPIYAYSDRIIGKLLDMASPEATFILLSDHGFGFEGGGFGHYDMREIPHGIILIKGPNIRKGYEIQNAHIYDVLPTLLYLVGMPVGRDMDGKVLTGAFLEKFLEKNKPD